MKMLRSRKGKFLLHVISFMHDKPAALTQRRQSGKEYGLWSLLDLPLTWDHASYLALGASVCTGR